MASHVSTFMPMDMPINGSSQPIHRSRSRKEKEKGRKGEKGKGEKKERKERKERKRKRKRERGRRPVVSSSVHWCSDGRNWLDQGVKSGDLTRGYALRGRDSSYFGLFLAFGLLFWANFGTMLCHVNGMGRICSRFKGLLLERIWVENLHLRELPKCFCNPRHAIAWIGAIVWLLVYSNFRRSYLSCPNSDLRVLGLYEKIFESRI